MEFELESVQPIVQCLHVGDFAEVTVCGVEIGTKGDNELTHAAVTGESSESFQPSVGRCNRSATELGEKAKLEWVNPVTIEWTWPLRWGNSIIIEQDIRAFVSFIDGCSVDERSVECLGKRNC